MPAVCDRCPGTKRRPRADPWQPVERRCYCGASFVASQPRQRYCSARCRHTARWQPRAELCRWCGCQFEATHTRQFCSPRCYRKAKWQRDKARGYKPPAEALRERRRRKNGRRRAATAGVVHVPYSERAIFERDGWACQLCGYPIDPTVKDRRQPHGASIDHVVPVSRGGADAPWNVRAAHTGCNAARGTGELRGLRLTG